MSFFVDNLPLFLMALTSGGLLLWPLVKGSGGLGGGMRVGTAEAVRLVNRDKAVLIDVGEPAEFADGHAAGARNVPLGQLDGHRSLPSNKALPLVLLCPTGTRAGRAAALLRKAGHAQAVAVAGGTNAWREAQLPIAKGASSAPDPGGERPAAVPRAPKAARVARDRASVAAPPAATAAVASVAPSGAAAPTATGSADVVLAASPQAATSAAAAVTAATSDEEVGAPSPHPAPESPAAR